ncbi:hypothetical protein C9J85_07950 [Haloferax sp. wsp5]|nr:hypothetical protein C9J85_07950 [Haloferax sp. wsp5]
MDEFSRLPFYAVVMVDSRSPPAHLPLLQAHVYRVTGQNTALLGDHSIASSTGPARSSLGWSNER